MFGQIIFTYPNILSEYDIECLEMFKASPKIIVSLKLGTFLNAVVS